MRKRANSRKNLVATAALAVVSLLAGAGCAGAGDAAAAHAAQGAAQQQGNEWRWRGSLSAGRAIEVKGVNGGIEAEPSSGGEVEVIAVKSARKSNPDDVRIEVIEHAEGVTVCAVYPTRDGDKPNVCAPGSGGRMSTRNNDVSVHFRVRVPAGVRFEGRTVNGEVKAEGLSADVVATTVNGSVRVKTTGLARAQTVNGSIRAWMGRADWSNELEFQTVNGTIDLSFPASLSADVHAETVNGEITSDFPLTVTGRFSKRRLDGTIGGGGRELRLQTVNGSVQIRRG